MATFRSLIRCLARGITQGDLPPVGEKIIWWGKPEPLPTYKGFEAYWVDSGTSALALTIIAAKQLRPEVENPEVIIPAYGCPDLIAATVYAKVQPILVDIGKDDPGYDLDQLEDAINKNTIAAIAVNFLGISDRLKEIKALLPQNIYLIEDNAQCYAAIAEPEKIVGDFSITSFGRGKPVSLLGGGVALIRTEEHDKITIKKDIQAPKKSKLLKLKIALYNILLKPQLYFFINHCPFITLGQTHYQPLKSINQLDKKREKLLAINISRHLKSSKTNLIYKKGYLTTETDLASKLNDRSSKLLRYPLLAKDKKSREKYMKDSYLLGLGYSAMYKKDLINIDNIKKFTAVHSTNNAKSFAEKLLTQPCKPPNELDS